MIRVAVVTLCLPVHGCETGSGGAVELSWKFRPASSQRTDKFVDCQPDSIRGDSYEGWGPIAKVQLHWTTGSEGACAKPPCDEAWDCGANHGATRFELPEGLANLSVTLECNGGQPAAQDTYIAPAIVQRDVMRGQTASLGAIELVVAVTGCATAGAASSNIGTQVCICPNMN
jgi:hypothetical protein